MARRAAEPEPQRRYAGLSADERRAGRRERLIQSAIEHYGTSGYRTTTIPQLCRTAGVTARHFYEDFPTQESLLTAAYDRIASEMIERIRHALEINVRNPYESFRAGVDAYFTYVTSDKRRARIFALEVIGVGPDLDRHRLAMRDRFVSIASANAARFGYDGSDLDARLLSLGLVGVTDVLLLDWVVGRRRHTVASMAETVATIWIRTLRLDRWKSRGKAAPPVAAAKSVTGTAKAAKRTADAKAVGTTKRAAPRRGSAAPKRKRSS